MRRTTPALSIDVFTEAEGALSAVAHDLHLTFREGWLELEGDRVRAAVETASLEPLGAMSHGVDAPGKLSARDLVKIRHNALTDVLDARRHPEIAFDGTLDRERGEVTGELRLHGVSRRVTVPVQQGEEGWTASLRVHQPDWKVKPYSALFGTLRVKPDVTVRVRVPQER